MKQVLQHQQNVQMVTLVLQLPKNVPFVLVAITVKNLNQSRLLVRVVTTVLKGQLHSLFVPLVITVFMVHLCLCNALVASIVREDSINALHAQQVSTVKLEFKHHRFVLPVLTVLKNQVRVFSVQRVISALKLHKKYLNVRLDPTQQQAQVFARFAQLEATVF